MNKKILKIVLIFLIILVSIGFIFFKTMKKEKISSSIQQLIGKDEDTYNMDVTVDLSKQTKKISPYIYGINDNGVLDKVKVNSIRQGGNRTSTYNWENNSSNAGLDANNISDNHFTSSTIPGMTAIEFSKKATTNNIKYKFTTLQMMGYVAADKNGVVNESAPSSRWKKVYPTKEAELQENPDTNDDCVYMDEYVNYLIKKLGNSTTQTGMQGYSLDNEPGLWSKTHSLAHPEKVTMEEVIDKSIKLAQVVKNADENADVIGPALYGINSYVNLNEDDNEEELTKWNELKKEKGYKWFIDYYLDKMKNASDEYGKRLLNYIDIHYYSETCDIPSKLLQASRTLYDKDFKEKSWVSEKYGEFLPILPNIQESIEKYFPDTKIAISEYNFRGGGNKIYEGIAEVQYLIAFAKYNVGLATYWGDYAPYVYSAINLFTNCEEYGDVGEYLVDTSSDDNSKIATFASTSNEDIKNADTLNIILTNNDLENSANITIDVKNANTKYKKAIIYGITKEQSEIIKFEDLENINDNKFTITIPSVSACRVVLINN